MKKIVLILISIAKQYDSARITCFIILASSLMAQTGCEVDDIPEIDNTPPEFSFTISGPGGTFTFTEEDDFANLQLNIKANSTYRFNYLGSDQGGVSFLSFAITPHDFFELDRLSPATVIDEQTGFRRTLWQIGDRNNPITVLGLSGRLLTPAIQNEIVATSLFFVVKDFGGDERAINTTSAELLVNVTNNDDELGIVFFSD